MIDRSKPKEGIKGLEQFRLKTLGEHSARMRKVNRASKIHQQIKETQDNKYFPKKVKILKYRRETRDDFYIRVGFDVQHQPGQFVQLGIPGYGECPISICSHSDQYMEFNIREVGNLTRKLANKKKGDYLWIRGPYGNGYPMERFRGNDLIIVGGGTGVAPLKGIIDYVDKHRDSYGNVSLFFGFRSPKDILFKSEMAKWRQSYDLNLSVDTNPEHLTMGCDVCYITNLLENAQFNNENKTVFVCGPPIMLNLVINILKKKDFKDNQIYLSLERMMHCAVGVCGHCMVNGMYICKDGPVVRYDKFKEQDVE